MTQNTERKVRTRELQITLLLQEFGGAFYEKGLRYVDSMKSPDLIEAIIEAEARGAAEQRRKDAEGYLFVNPDTGTEYLPYHPVESGECTDAENIREATSAELLSELQGAWVSWKEDRTKKEKVAANVAALEARVKVLEAEKVARDKAREHNWFYMREDPECSHSDVSGLLDDLCPLEMVQISEAADVRTFWAFQRAHGEIFEFDTEEEALAALTREGGV